MPQITSIVSPASTKKEDTVRISEECQRVVSLYGELKSTDNKLKRLKAELEEAKAELATDLLGRKVVFDPARNHAFWPKQKGQRWFGGDWKGEGIHGHFPEAEKSTEGPSKTQGLVVYQGPHPNLKEIKTVIVEEEYWYVRVPLSPHNLGNLTVLTK